MNKKIIVTISIITIIVITLSISSNSVLDKSIISQTIFVDAVYEPKNNLVKITYNDNSKKTNLVILEILGMEQTFHKEFSQNSFVETIQINSEPKYGWSTMPVVFSINHDEFGKIELKTEIPGAQTWRIDRTGLAHAVELREPFLDYRLVEFSTTIPSHLKINTSNGTKKKYILQKLALELLPKEVTKRKKFPWGIPFYDFFKSEFLPIAEAVINKSLILNRPYLNQNNSYITKICNKIKDARSELSKDVEINDAILRQILFLFNLELWYQIFIESDNVKKPDLSLNRFV